MGTLKYIKKGTFATFLTLV